MQKLRRSRFHFLINILLSVLILHQGLTFTLLNSNFRTSCTNEAFESYFIEFLEWLSGKDIDISPFTSNISEPEQGAEEDRSEKETKKINYSLTQFQYSQTKKALRLCIQDENSIPASYIVPATPPPELA